ncbi:Tol-Pal system beta propeller repeat protein TolB [Glycocaulis abyssi]|uniref:Tol-Pal system protein TolB n=1 Tax=Glycocaulis abyssi TaxID=1433403 RepID=A0ABV9NC89_9PROT
MRFLARLAAMFAMIAALAAPALAQSGSPLVVTVTDGNVDPFPIAITDFIAQDAQSAETGVDIARVVTNNLANSGLFAPVSQDAFIEDITNIDLRPRFADWRLINASALLVGRVSIDDQGRLLVAFRLWDTAAEQQLLGMQFTSVPENWRRLAHKVSDAVYERLTGESGFFDTRIVYVSEGEGPDGEPTRRLVIMDQDGANPSFLTDRSYMALLPNYSPTSQQITYVSFRDLQATSYLYDLQTGRQEALFDSSNAAITGGGQSLSARFHPNGRELVMSVERRGRHDLYGFDLRTRALRQLTSNPSDDTEPTYSPDGRQIAFASNRSGQPQIYVMNADGTDQRRISFGPGRYTSPVWSPRGDLIAFIKQQGSMFSLGVMRADGSGEERILYDGYFVDTPAWSPNGRMLLFTRGDYSTTGTRYAIWSVDLGGFNLRRLPTQGAASDAAWSPLLD